MATQVQGPTPPLTDATAAVISRMVDDHGQSPREPSHSMLESLMERAGLGGLDPGRDRSRPIGKEKRLRAALNAALTEDPLAGGRLVGLVVAEIRGCGGFRTASPNFIGGAVIADAQAVFSGEGWALGPDGDLRPILLDRLDGLAARATLESYVRRIRQGYDDNALVLGTSKDLLEATAAHVVMERYGAYNAHADFPTLLGQAFVAVGFATPADRVVAGEPPHRAVERSWYELGCAVNRLRNKEGTGHGRPFLPSVTAGQAKSAANAIALVSEALLAALG
jgi:hypothetical protein